MRSRLAYFSHWEVSPNPRYGEPRLQSMPLIIGGVAAAAIANSEDAPAINKVTPTWDFYYGATMGILSLWWSFSYPEKFADHNYETLAENLINSIAYQAKQGSMAVQWSNSSSC